jgi:hypothetical protein
MGSADGEEDSIPPLFLFCWSCLETFTARAIRTARPYSLFTTRAGRPYAVITQRNLPLVNIPLLLTSSSLEDASHNLGCINMNLSGDLLSNRMQQMPA